jgi:Predicted nucleotide-binding protein containing TIR-like domain
MTTPRVVKQELVVHLFAPLDGPDAEKAFQQLRQLWGLCRDLLGMSEPIPGYPPPDFLDRMPARSGPDRAIAAQLNPVTCDQAVARVLHDVLNISVGLAQPPADRPDAGPRDWAGFAGLWSQVSRLGLDALVGETRLLLARTPLGEPAPVDATPGLGQALDPLLPPDPGRPGYWWQWGTKTAQGYALWDTALASDRSQSREIVLISAWDRHEELSAWAWYDGTTALPPLGGYLMHAAKVRYEARLLDAWEARAEPSAGSGAGASPAERLPGLEAELATLVRTAAVARTNLGRAAREDGANGTGGMFAADRELATWVVDQAETNLAYLRIEIEKIVRARELNGGRDPRPPEPPEVPEPSESSAAADSPVKAASVFVVHGRDEKLAGQFRDLLRTVCLRPLEWETLVAGTESAAPFLGDVVAAAPHLAQATLVLLSPDDVVQLHSQLFLDVDSDAERELSAQSRPNVLFELGQALMAYPTRTVIVEVGKPRPFADLAGRNVIKFDGSTVSIKKVLDRLGAAGCPVDMSGTDWMNAERFADLAAYRRGPATHAPPPAAPGS